MAVQTGGQSPLRVTTPIVVELSIVTTLLVSLFLWERLLRRLTEPLSIAFESVPSIGVLTASGLATSVLFIGGLTLFAAAYATYRDVDIGLALPTSADRRLIGLAGGTPVALVGATYLVGTVSGVTYSSLTMTSYSASAPVMPILQLIGLGLLVAVPSLVLVCQVLVQGSFKQVLGSDATVVVTTLVTGFVMMSNTGGFATVPDRGKLIGAVALVVVLGIAAVATESADRDRLRYLAYLPLAFFVGLVIVAGIAEMESIAAMLFTVTHLAVLGIAAYTYERSRSLVVPAFAYMTLSLANSAVLLIEAGLLVS